MKLELRLEEENHTTSGKIDQSSKKKYWSHRKVAWLSFSSL
jgi:hypothetical protein